MLWLSKNILDNGLEENLQVSKTKNNKVLINWE